MSGTLVGNGVIGVKTTKLLLLGISQSYREERKTLSTVKLVNTILKVWTMYHEDPKKGRGT